MKSGASLGLVDKRDGKGGLPLLIWGVREHDSAVFEAQLENSERGHYHGYPLLETDFFRAQIVTAYRERSA